MNLYYFVKYLLRTRWNRIRRWRNQAALGYCRIVREERELPAMLAEMRAWDAEIHAKIAAKQETRA